LIVQQVEDETVVYDLQAHKAHCLNRTSAAVWRLCDGHTSVPEMVAALRGSLQVPIDAESVRLAMTELHRARLLDQPPKPAGRVHPSRRELLFRLGAGAALWFPVIASIKAPTATHAASGVCLTSDCKNLRLVGCCCGNKRKVCIAINATQGNCGTVVC